ncbi:MAG: hypothetical protein HY864_02260 [Chloroflexi bacterium]|nr:hypothetical protein [Chloroflexota bacterium]
MPRFPIFFSIMAAIAMILASACVPNSEPQFADFDPANFDNPTDIDNAWMPMKPGMKWVQEGKAVEDGETISRRIDFIVTDLTKVIGGVRTVTAWIVDYTDGEVIEKELAFYAQDNDGNVWYLGEYPEEFENGQFVKASPWITGLEDARAGIKMRAEPKLAAPIVYQGWGPAVEWSDFGQVDQVGQETCVPVDCYKDVLVMAESSLGEENAFQLKHYARGVGEIKVGWRGADEVKEELELVDFSMLSSQQMEQTRADALEVEKHAYEVSGVYQQTSPVEYPAGTPAITVEITKAPQPDPMQAPASEIIIYAVDLPDSALSELDFYDDAASPGKKYISLPNNGDELDPPPENDPHLTFDVQVQSGIPYRCWIHMKVGMPKGRSTANLIFVQFSGAVDANNKTVLKPGSSSYLTARGSTTGWSWVGCDFADSDSLIYFQGGEVTVRLQAGAEGVGFDQLILSSTEFLAEPPSSPIVEK